MLWIFLAILAYFLLAVSSLADRYLLAGPLQRPLVYTFYTGITGIAAVIFIPFGFFVPQLWIIALSFAAGIISVLALFALYHTTLHGNVSRVVPLVGAFLPIMTLILISSLHDGLEGVSLSKQLQVALFILLPATFLLAADPKERHYVPSATDLIHAIITAFLFAAGFVSAKMVFEFLPFVNGFIWMRFGGFLAAASLLIIPGVRATVFAHNPLKRKNILLPMVMGKGGGALGFLAQQYAIAIANVGEIAIINALQGVQYLFLVVMVVVFGIRDPRILHETLSGKSLIVRGLGVALLAIGLFILLKQ
ncbi:MAG: hypothetical protein HYV65_01540 [Candidatus Spechtbacteria bacterium]|nr:hypothetical protein [Candidatus Spechtbacteria bacterium]